MAAHNWRALRTRAWEKGHPDLMAMPSMHVVLDAMEQPGLESAVSGAKTSTEAQADTSDYGMVVSVTYQNRAERPDQLTARLAAEIAQRRELLTVAQFWQYAEPGNHGAVGLSLPGAQDINLAFAEHQNHGRGEVLQLYPQYLAQQALAGGF